MIIWSDILSGLSLSVCFSFCNIHCQAQLSWSISHQLGLVLLLVSAIRSHFLYFIAPHLSCSVWSGPNSVLNVNVCQRSNSVTMHYPCLEGSILFCLLELVPNVCLIHYRLLPSLLLEDINLTLLDFFFEVQYAWPKLVFLAQLVSSCVFAQFGTFIRKRFRFSVPYLNWTQCFFSASDCLRGSLCVCLNWYPTFLFCKCLSEGTNWCLSEMSVFSASVCLRGSILCLPERVHNVSFLQVSV